MLGITGTIHKASRSFRLKNMGVKISPYLQKKMIFWMLLLHKNLILQRKLLPLFFHRSIPKVASRLQNKYRFPFSVIYSLVQFEKINLHNRWKNASYIFIVLSLSHFINLMLWNLRAFYRIPNKYDTLIFFLRQLFFLLLKFWKSLSYNSSS